MIEPLGLHDALRKHDGAGRPESPGGDAHYRQGGIEPVELIISNNLEGWKTEVIRRVFRAGHKPSLRALLAGADEGEARRVGELEDIDKAIWWLQKRRSWLTEQRGT